MPKRKAASTSSSSSSPTKIKRTEESNDDFCTQLRQLVHEGADNAQLEQLVATFYPPLPQVQGQAPEFSALALMPNKEFIEINLSDYKGKWVVFFWYPLDFTFVCPTEIIAFGDRQNEFSAINAQVIAASCDSHFTHLAWVNTPRSEGGLGDMKIPILADFNKKVASSYGCLLKDGGIPLRALYIIDPTGMIRHMTINDLPVGRNVDEALRLIKAFQFVETHGEVCPANWQPGSATMNPDPVKSKEYFHKVHSSTSSGMDET